MADTVRVKGLREFQRALAKGDKETKKQVRDRLKKVGEIVRVAAAERFSGIDAGSASGFRVAVRQRGVAVEQSRKRTTGLRGDYGALQMRRALVPAVDEKEGEVVDEFERALDDIADIVERG